MVFSNFNFLLLIFCFWPPFAVDKQIYVLRIIFPLHFPLTFKNVRVVKSTGSVRFTHTFHLSKFILDVTFMSKKEKRQKRKTVNDK